MCSNLSCYQLIIQCYICLNLTVISPQKLRLNRFFLMRKESKHNTKESHQTAKEESKRKAERSCMSSQKTAQGGSK